MAKNESFSSLSCTCSPEVVDGYAWNHFIGQYFHECAYTSWEVASFAVGMSSLCFWIACQVPQFLKNQKRKSTQGLSKCFLAEWFLGDAFNLAGCILTKQLVTQLATSILFVCVDFLMICQIMYYSKPKRKLSFPDLKEKLVPESVSETYEAIEQVDESGKSSTENTRPVKRKRPDPSTPTHSRYLRLAGFLTLIGGAGYLLFRRKEVVLTPVKDLPSCENDVELGGTESDLGVLLGWLSAFAYLNSRLPQVIKNCKRKSVEGLSWVMFFCAVMGNTTYGLGVLLKDSSEEAIQKSLPWLAGSLGTLCFDFFILFQFWTYGKPKRVRQRRLLVDELADDGESVDSQDSQLRGIFGLKDWTSSPFFKPGKDTLQDS